MPAQVREEVTEVGCCGDAGMDQEGLLGVWGATYGSTFFQVLGTHFSVLRQRLAEGRAEYTAGTGNVGTNGEEFGEKGSG